MDHKLVKSALRALEVLEFFNEDRPTASVNDVARHYRYPQSSTSELMNCLVSLGYLRRDESGRKFLPSSRVATLGCWVQPKLFRHGNLYTLMDELAAATRASVTLAGVNMARIQFLHVVGSPEERSRIVLEDAAVSLLRSAEGLALLSTYSEKEIRGLVHRLNSELAEAFRVKLPDLRTQLKAIGIRGYAVGNDAEQLRGLAIVLPHAARSERLVLGVRPGPESPDEETIGRMLRSGFGQHLGLVAVAAGDAPSREPQRIAG